MSTCTRIVRGFIRCTLLLAFISLVAVSGLFFLKGYVHARKQVIPTIIPPSVDFEQASRPPLALVLGRMKDMAMRRQGYLGPEEPKAVAFTFDDGPYALLTPALLDLLRRHHIRATFFIEGKDIEMQPDMVRRIVADGHELGNHSYSHRSFVTLDDASITDELERTTSLIESLTGVRPCLMRPPGGKLDPKRMQLVQKLGYTVVFDNVNPGDWRECDPLRIYDWTLMHNINRSVVLMHSGRLATIRALPTIIDAFRRKGYRFTTVSELARLKQIAVPPLPPRRAAGTPRQG